MRTVTRSMAVALGGLAIVAFGAAAQDVKTFKVAYVQAKVRGR